MLLRPRFLILACAIVASPAIAGPESDGQTWLTTSTNGPISGRIDGSLDITARIGGADHGLYELELAALIGVKLGDAIELSGGYIHNPGYRDGMFVEMERRAREQITAKLGDLSGGRLSGRVRTEQRWIDGSDGTGWRIRPWLQWSLPIDRNGLAINLSHESFINLNTTSWGQHAGYDRMRNAASLSRPLTKRIAIEGGYLNQYSFGHGGHDQIANVFTLGVGVGW